jgi:protease-4
MEYGKLEKLARGRVYTGAMAIKLNLVDELGTLDDAVAYAAKLGGLPAGEKTERWLLPAPVSPLEAIFGSMDADAESSLSFNRGLAQTLRQISPELAETLQGAWLVNLLAREPRLTLMPFQLRVH